MKQGDNSFNEGLIKMVESYKKGTRSKNSSSLHSYGKRFELAVARGRNLKVQPEAVKRRKYRNGSRNKHKHPNAKKAGRSMSSYTHYPKATGGN